MPQVFPKGSYSRKKRLPCSKSVRQSFFVSQASPQRTISFISRVFFMSITR